jgi:hypothetical protein
VNLTPMRIAQLRLVERQPGIRIAALADKLAPRVSSTGLVYGWTGQGAARWGAGYVKPLVQAGLLAADHRVDSGVGLLTITQAGQRCLAEQGAVSDPVAPMAAVASRV